MAGLSLCICPSSVFLSFCKPTSEPLDQAASRICAFRGLFHGFGKLVLVSPLQTIKREPWSFVSTAGHTSRDGLSGDETSRCQEQLLGGAMSEMEMDLVAKSYKARESGREREREGGSYSEVGLQKLKNTELGQMHKDKPAMFASLQ
jgi:hypothetical protein